LDSTSKPFFFLGKIWESNQFPLVDLRPSSSKKLAKFFCSVPFINSECMGVIVGHTITAVSETLPANFLCDTQRIHCRGRRVTETVLETRWGRSQAGLLGLRAETPEQVRPLITEALRHDVPALVEVPVNRQELSMPPTITLEQMKGLSLFMIRAVLSGRGDEIIDLVKTNLFR